MKLFLMNPLEREQFRRFGFIGAIIALLLIAGAMESADNYSATLAKQSMRDDTVYSCVDGVQGYIDDAGWHAEYKYRGSHKTKIPEKCWREK